MNKNELIKKLSDDELMRVSGGSAEKSKLDEIMNELSNWLDKHPNATKADVYSILKNMMYEYSDELTKEELEMLMELLQSLES